MKAIILNRNYVKPLPLYKDRQEFVKAKEEHMLTFEEVFIGFNAYVGMMVDACDFYCDDAIDAIKEAGFFKQRLKKGCNEAYAEVRYATDKLLREVKSSDRERLYYAVRDTVRDKAEEKARVMRRYFCQEARKWKVKHSTLLSRVYVANTLLRLCREQYDSYMDYQVGIIRKIELEMGLDRDLAKIFDFYKGHLRLSRAGKIWQEQVLDELSKMLHAEAMNLDNEDMKRAFDQMKRYFTDGDFFDKSIDEAIESEANDGRIYHHPTPEERLDGLREAARKQIGEEEMRKDGMI